MAVHVIPLNDLKPHVESGEWCHCQPRIDRSEREPIVTHNAYDGREFAEAETDFLETYLRSAYWEDYMGNT